ncbi:MAG: hypothetical protein MI919_33090, partial [Holophagales bacterium]|nr:hypothetical protein [Holophagales bacterium]
GTLNGCYLQADDWRIRGMDMELGRISTAEGVELRAEQVHYLRSVIVDKPRCRDCLCQWSCAGGCHVSNTYLSCPEEYVDFCVQTRVITACLLLEELGEPALVDQLLDDRDAMLRLALHESDVIEPVASPDPPDDPTPDRHHAPMRA